MTGRDRVDILLDLDRDYQTYYRFQIDHRGCLAEDCWGDKTWNPKYFAAFHSTDTGWTAEIAIPLAGVDRRPSVARADVGGERVARGAGEGYPVVERSGRRDAAARGHGPAAIPRGEVSFRMRDPPENPGGFILQGVWSFPLPQQSVWPRIFRDPAGQQQPSQVQESECSEVGYPVAG